MADERRMIWAFLALLALGGLGGCSASSAAPGFQTAYSAVGAQIK
jgi:hypothetical protein